MLEADTPSRSYHVIGKLVALALAVGVIGLPVNTGVGYVLLVAATVVVLSGRLRFQGRAWIAALAIAVVAIAGQVWLAPPRIDEGHNVFLPGGPNPVLERGLPPDVYRQLKHDFDLQYPAAKHCAPQADGCWLGRGFPDRVYAFSADGILHPSDMSRSVTAIDFSDPVWLGLGFTNEAQYNWYPVSDIQRARRDGRVWMALHRWHLTMPWFEMIRLPAAYVGGQLCWRGDIMWEGADQRFSLQHGDGCRAVTPADAGRRVAGLAIKPDTLAMRLEPPFKVRLLQWAQGGLMVAGLVGLMVVLVRVEPRRLILPAVLLGLSVLMIGLADASFLGGLRPLDGGDDGLFYDGVARAMLQQLLAGDWTGFLIGGEPVYYYGGPGLRYALALQHIVFGETFLGYLSLVLAMPFVVYGLLRRFLLPPWPIVLVLGFIAVPVGEFFGTTFIDYFKWASRGYADPASYIVFLAGLLVLVGDKHDGPGNRFLPALGGGLLMALALWFRPIVAPAAAVFLGGAGLAALYQWQWRRLFGLCIGFAPVFLMALHNWVFGHALVLFSANDAHPLVLVMPPSAYPAMLHELAHLDFTGPALSRWLSNMLAWLTGNSETPWQGAAGYARFILIPLHALAVAIVVYVAVRRRRFDPKFDPWLRLIAGAALAQHAIVLFYTAATARYHFLTWFLTLLVVLVFMQQIGFEWFGRRYPALADRILRHPWSMRLGLGLSWLKRATA
ncbi:MAG: hypothetical protein GC182_24330 [Rhodopseudomonas sp.]|nr:hypothetical protein [Rhodopseudomonas sp.]